MTWRAKFSREPVGVHDVAQIVTEDQVVLVGPRRAGCPALVDLGAAMSSEHIDGVFVEVDDSAAALPVGS